MAIIKPLTECTIDEILIAWNQGFEGYFTDVTMNSDQFLKRLAFQELSAVLSFVAFEANVPVGIVLNGVRVIEGKKVAWNGGTGVSKLHRGYGIGRQLIQESLRVYKNEHVDAATLESISENKSAIHLYRAMGYSINEHLNILRTTDSLKKDILSINETTRFNIERGPAYYAAAIPFYCTSYPWQNQWQSLKDGECFILKVGDLPVGYALFKHKLDNQGNLTDIILFQCEFDPEYFSPMDVVKTLLSHVFLPETEGVNRVAFNLPESNTTATEILLKSNFRKSIEQVFMINPGLF